MTIRDGTSSCFVDSVRDITCMTTFRFVCAVAAVAMAHALVGAQTVSTPFKVGTFERQGRPFVGVVLRDSVVIDLPAAHAAVRGRRHGRRAPCRHAGPDHPL